MALADGEVVCTAADVPVQAVRWLWKDHFAIGKISLVVGTANVGKSLLVCGDFASRVSVGAAWPDGSPCPAGDVAIVGRPESVADTLVPRLVSHGADLRRVHFVDPLAYLQVDEGCRLEMPEVVLALHEAVRKQRGVNLAIIDPVTDFLLKCRAAVVAHALTALEVMARRFGLALVLVVDLREGSRGMGPAALVSAGADWPDGTPCPAGDVAIVSRRASVADVLVPRLVSHGANLRRDHFVGSEYWRGAHCLSMSISRLLSVLSCSSWAVRLYPNKNTWTPGMDLRT